MASLGYLQFPGGAGDNVLGTADKPQLDITGSLDLIVCLNVQVDQTIGLVHKFGSNSGFRWLYNPNTSTQFAYGNGTSEVFEQPSISVEDLDTDHWLRVTFDAANGNRVWYYSADPPDTPVGEVSWTQIASEPGGGAASIAANALTLYVNTYDGTNRDRTWRLYALWVYDGISTSGGTLVANPDFRTGTPDWSGGSASDGLGNTWTINGNAFWTPPTDDAQDLEGTALSVAPSFPGGQVSPGPVNLVGSVLAATTTFPAGDITTTIEVAGQLLSVPVSFPQGETSQVYGIHGTLLEASPTFPGGTVDRGPVTLTGSTLGVSPVFPGGAVSPGAVTLSGTPLTADVGFPGGHIHRVVVHPDGPATVTVDPIPPAEVALDILVGTAEYA